MLTIHHLVSDREDGAGCFASSLCTYLAGMGVSSSVTGPLPRFPISPYIKQGFYYLVKKYPSTISLVLVDWLFHKYSPPHTPSGAKIAILYGFNKFAIWLVLNRWRYQSVFIYSIDAEGYSSVCHHSYDCINYETGCSSCPQVKAIWRPLVSLNSFLKSRMYRKYVTAILCENAYSLRLVTSSNISGRVLSKVVGLATDVPTDSDSASRDFLRRMSTGGDNTIFVLCSASNILNPRKRVLDIIEAFKCIRVENAVLVVVGLNAQRFSSVHDNIVALDALSLRDYLLIASACHIFVSASTHDLGPTTISQAFSMGLFLCSTPTGEALEHISPGLNGYFVHHDLHDLQHMLAKTINLCKFSPRPSRVDLMHQVASRLLDMCADSMA